MRVRGIIAEDFSNFKEPAMFIVSAECDWKCCKEIGADVSLCQNAGLASSPVLDIADGEIVEMYLRNNITRAIVVGGLEPMLQFEELDSLISAFRERGCQDTFVVYTGYYPEEIADKIPRLHGRNVIVKFGRFIPDSTKVFSDVLGVTLVSANQFAVAL